MQSKLDPRLVDVFAKLIDFRSFSTWLTGGAKRIVFDKIAPSQAFRPGTLLIGTNPDIDWDQELRLIYRDCLSREQQDWFRACLASELELLNPHQNPEKAETYVDFLLSMTRILKAREVTPDILFSLIRQRFPQSQVVFDNVLLAWCNLPTGIEQSSAANRVSSSERLVDFVINDQRYSPQKWMLHLLIGLVRKMPTHLEEHLGRFSDDSSAALLSGLSDRRKQMTLFELERLADLVRTPWVSLYRTVPIQRLRTSLYPPAVESQQKQSMANVYDIDIARQQRSRASFSGSSKLDSIQRRRGAQ